jgi:hypothetical protein
MSDDSIPAPDDQHKPDPLLITIPPCDAMPPSAEVFQAFWDMRRLGWTDSPPAKPPAKPKRRREERTSGLQVTLHSLKTFGFTHPKDGSWLMAPLEFEAILALETKAVAQVVWEVMRQTIGRRDESTGDRQEWVQLSSRHFERYGIMARGAARRGLDDAVQHGYLRQRRRGRSFEYALKWKGVNN